MANFIEYQTTDDWKGVEIIGLPERKQIVINVLSTWICIEKQWNHDTIEQWKWNGQVTSMDKLHWF